MKDLNIHSSWKTFINEEQNKPYFVDLFSYIRQQRNERKIIFPSDDAIFKAFELTPLHDVQVLLLGQDPYHEVGQAQGISFSVPDGIKIPPSLRNIYQEIASDLSINPPTSGDLTPWARQGVFLLNTALTVEEGKPGSHAKIGWECFTDEVIRVISTRNDHVVFLLWGNFAQRKRALIDETKHLVLTTSHPSPLSYYRGFKGCKHFSATNQYLIAHKKKPIQWG